MALQITDQNFNDYIKDAKPLVLDFWAQWCGPCKALGPHIEELAGEYEGKVNIGKVDVDSNPELTSTYRVRNIPTVLFIKGGEIVDKQVGYTTKEGLKAKIDKLF